MRIERSSADEFPDIDQLETGPHVYHVLNDADERIAGPFAAEGAAGAWIKHSQTHFMFRNVRNLFGE